MTFTLPLSFFLKSPARYSLRPYSISCLLFKFLRNPFFSSGHLCFFVMIAKVDYFQARSLNLIKTVVPPFQERTTQDISSRKKGTIYMGRSSMGPSFPRSFWEKIILLPTIEEYFSKNAVMDS